MGGKPGCHPHSSPLNLPESVQHSCNSYYCYVFRSIIDNKKYKNVYEGYDVWRNYVLSFGVGVKLNSDLPQELRGMVPSIKYYDKYFGKGSWRSSTVVSLSIGQGELGITPLQMANIMATIANRGYYYTPHIIKKVGNRSDFRKDFLEKHYTKVESKYYGIMIQGMEQVVEAGTARVAKIKDLPICGKTGTAQNPHGKDHSLFVGFAPKDNPKIAIAVMVENSGFGATWAAPIASLMIEKYLRDSISRPELEKRMLEGNLIPEHKKVKM
jgi:penicillin-binding protein 2